MEDETKYWLLYISFNESWFDTESKIISRWYTLRN